MFLKALLFKTKYLLIAILIILNFSISAFAANFENEAKIFYNLGLYNGVSPNYFDPDLNSFLDRETTVVFLLRLIGKKENALKMENDQVNSILIKYSDYNQISSWARKYVAYAVKENIISGNLDNTLSPKKFIYGRTFATMILNYLGYNLEGDNWSISTYILSYLGGMTANDAKNWNEKALTKDDLIGISWKTMNAKASDNIVFLDKVIKNNNIKKKDLEKLGFEYSNDKIKMPIFQQTVTNTNTNANTQYNQNPYYSYNNVSYKMQDGSNYTGEASNGIPNGKGVVNYADGSRYEGQVANGQREGEGTLVRPDGFSYIGSWKSDKMNGYGVFKWKNGDEYSGEIRDGVFQGQGSFRWANVDNYTGGWNNGNFHGYGVFKWANGNFYEGNWTDGKFNGYGVFRWVNGDTYEGEWKNGTKHGKGKFSFSNNRVQDGYWDNNKFKQ